MRFESTRSDVAPFTHFYLEIFADSDLLPTSLISLSALDNCFKFDLTHFKLAICYFNENDSLRQRNFSYSLNTLLKECKEVQEFAAKYYPEYAI